MFSRLAVGGARRLSSAVARHGARCNVVPMARSTVVISRRTLADVAADKDGEKFAFQAETRELLNIVAKSLYTDTEVFLRELVSNSSDALEKARYLQLTNEGGDTQEDLRIKVTLSETDNTITIQDNGVGMSREELISNLGTIAHSGSKSLLQTLHAEGKAKLDNIIGQFGVGFYSCFMVADSVTVYSAPRGGGDGHCWTSNGDGTFTIKEHADVAPGTKIVLHLKDTATQFAKVSTVKSVLSKYAAFLAFPVEVDGQLLNTIQALWMKTPSQVSDTEHVELYRFLSNAYDEPIFRLHFAADAPLSIHAVLYVPQSQPPALFGQRQAEESGVSIYSKRVLIQSKANKVLPRWLHFLKGVIDCEDIPLNLSREHMQDSALMRKIGDVITQRVIRWLVDEAKKDETKYDIFYKEFGHNIKEAIMTDPTRANNIAKLLRFTSTRFEDNALCFLSDYVSRMPEGQNKIYFILASTRELALQSPYMESYLKDGTEVLLLLHPADEFVLTALHNFEGKTLVNVEHANAEPPKPAAENAETATSGALSETEMKELCAWLMNEAIPGTTTGIKPTTRLVRHPAVIVGHESSQMRDLQRLHGIAPKPATFQLHLNPSHPIIRALFECKSVDPSKAKAVAEQILDTAKIAAGIMDDMKEIVPRLTRLVAHTLGVQADDEKKEA